MRRLLRSRTPYLRICSASALFFLSWYLLVDVFGFWRFRELPGFVASFKEWVSPESGLRRFAFHRRVLQPHLGVGISRLRVRSSCATCLGIAIGIFMGWSRIFYGLTFPLLELLRPIPILAWIPLAILLAAGT